jgi:hypothetical protein
VNLECLGVAHVCLGGVFAQALLLSYACFLWRLNIDSLFVFVAIVNIFSFVLIILC